MPHYKYLTDWPQERRRIANFHHDMRQSIERHGTRHVCPDCFQPASNCKHRKDWQFLVRS